MKYLIKIKQEVRESFFNEWGYYPENVKVLDDSEFADADHYWCKITKTGKVKKNSWRLSNS